MMKRVLLEIYMNDRFHTIKRRLDYFLLLVHILHTYIIHLIQSYEHITRISLRGNLFSRVQKMRKLSQLFSYVLFYPFPIIRVWYNHYH